MIPAHQPRVRGEWLIAAARVALTLGILTFALVAPELPSRGLSLYLTAWYLLYSVGMLALVWAPLKFARGWDYAVHGFDLAAFAVLVGTSGGASTPLLTSAIFLLVCGMLRWQLVGVLSTAALVFAVAVSAAPVGASGPAPLTWPVFAVDLTALAVVTAFLASVTIYHARHQMEIARLAGWPRSLAQDQRDVLQEIIAHAGELMGAPRVLLLWWEADEDLVNLAWSGDAGLEWVREPEETLGSVVAQDLTDRSFQATDASNPHGTVVVLTARGFRRSSKRSVHEALCARFTMKAVQSSPLAGELVRGRVFFLDQPRQRLDDLMLGDVVARLAAVRLDSFYVIRQMGEGAVLRERVRVARDLHDSLLQSQAGAAMQLMAARRLLDREPEAAKRSLEAIQVQLERSELDTRSFIRSLRPSSSPEPSQPLPFHERLQDLRRRLERQWNLKVELTFDGAVDALGGGLSEQVFRLVQEGTVNAARHASASVVRINLTCGLPGVLRVRIADDGRGFPFQGTYDLAALGAMDRGPLTLRERVTELNGDLTLTSTTAGSELLITLPVAHA